MRGAQDMRHTLIVCYRIIPAYAGSTEWSYQHYPAVQDHPRVCGEHLELNERQPVSKGSSPRMRGAPLGTPDGQPGRRIIPAYAGSTVQFQAVTTDLVDHPRVCGEHKRLTLIRQRQKGSSPRMRGALDPGAGIPVPPGIIPAYAGSTYPNRRITARDKDHPRVCREHFLR